MISKGANYQDMVLNYVRKEGIPVTVFLVSGYQVKGVVRAFDNYVILVDSDNKQQMIYKHAISTIAPMRTVRLTGEKPAESPNEEQ